MFIISTMIDLIMMTLTSLHYAGNAIRKYMQRDTSHAYMKTGHCRGGMSQKNMNHADRLDGVTC